MYSFWQFVVLSAMAKFIALSETVRFKKFANVMLALSCSVPEIYIVGVITYKLFANRFCISAGGGEGRKLASTKRWNMLVCDACYIRPVKNEACIRMLTHDKISQKRLDMFDKTRLVEGSWTMLGVHSHDGVKEKHKITTAQTTTERSEMRLADNNGKAYNWGLFSNAHTTKSHKTKLIHPHNGSQNEVLSKAH